MKNKTAQDLLIIHAHGAAAGCGSAHALGLQAAQEIEARLAMTARYVALPPTEQRIMALLLSRLEQGVGIYGAFHPAKDARDFSQEALEEVVDALHYVAMRLVQLAGGRETPVKVGVPFPPPPKGPAPEELAGLFAARALAVEATQYQTKQYKGHLPHGPFIVLDRLLESIDAAITTAENGSLQAPAFPPPGPPPPCAEAASTWMQGRGSTMMSFAHTDADAVCPAGLKPDEMKHDWGEPRSDGEQQCRRCGWIRLREPEEGR